MSNVLYSLFHVCIGCNTGASASSEVWQFRDSHKELQTPLPPPLEQAEEIAQTWISSGWDGRIGMEWWEAVDLSIGVSGVEVLVGLSGVWVGRSVGRFEWGYG